MTDDINDLDQAINDWADDRLGEGFTRENIDFSQVNISPRRLVYHQIESCLKIKKEGLENYHNPSNMPITWAYTHDISLESEIKWTLSNALQSKYLPSYSVHLISPPVDPALGHLECGIDNTELKEGCERHLVKKHSSPIRNQVDIDPYEELVVWTEVKSWNLNSVKWYVDLVISGDVKVIGHKKRKNWMKQEVKAGVEDVFLGLDDFHVVNTFGSSPEVVFKLRGLCEATVVAGWAVDEAKPQKTETTV